MKIIDSTKKNLFVKLLVFSFIVFTGSQLFVNSLLTPMGTKLQALNTEKEHLLEENRAISEEIAKSSSIKVIEKLSEKKLSLSQDNQQSYIYIEDPSLVANN